jgi:hypothetical protein
MEKTAFELGVADGINKVAFDPITIGGGFVGHHYGQEQKRRGEKYDFGHPQAASLLVPGGFGYQIGRYWGHKGDLPEDKKNKKKNS